MSRGNQGRTIAEFLIASMAVTGLGAALVVMSHELKSSQPLDAELTSTPVDSDSPVTPTSPGEVQATASVPLIGGRVWRGPVGPTSTASQTPLAASELADKRRFARSIAICTPDEAVEFISTQTGHDDWLFSIARRTSEDQIDRWLKAMPLTNPQQETSPVLWIVGAYSAHPLTNAEYHGWMIPIMETESAGYSSGVHSAVFVFTEDRAPVTVSEPPIKDTSLQDHPKSDHSTDEWIAALKRISDLPELPSQIESFPHLEGLCSMERD